MSGASPSDDVRAAAQAAAAGAGLVLESVTVRRAGRRSVLAVIVDLPEDAVGGVPMDRVTEAAQALSARLDDGELMGATPYVLEVSSPGTDRALTERRHWSRARGRLVQVPLAGGAALTARVVSVDDAGVLFEDRAEPVAWADLGAGRVQIEFNRPGAEDVDLDEDVADDDADLEDDADLDEDDTDEDDAADDVREGVVR